MHPLRSSLVVLVAALALLAAPPVTRAGGAHGGPADRIAALGEIGPYAPGFTSFTLVDAARAVPAGAESPRRIPVYLWYPVARRSIHAHSPRASIQLDPLYRPDLVASSLELEAQGLDPAWQDPAPAGGPFPLLVLSHGYTPPAWVLAGLAARLASHGIVVAVPVHAGDARWYGWEAEPTHFAWADYQRPRDVSFVLTALLRRGATRGDRLHGLFDRDLVAVGGWSLGGYAALALAGGDDTVRDYGLSDPYSFLDGPVPADLPDEPFPADRRVKAVVLLDGANQELRLRELARVRLPVLSLNQALATYDDPLQPGWPARGHAVLSSRVNLRVDVAGVNHFAFSDTCAALRLMAARGLPADWGDPAVVWNDLCATNRSPDEVRPLLARYAQAFLKSELEGERLYSRMLTTCWAQEHETGVELFTSEPVRPPVDGPEWPGLETYFMHPPVCQARGGGPH